jgi:hypothetical protein
MGKTYRFNCTKCQAEFESVHGTDRGRYSQLKSLLCTTTNTVVDCLSGRYSQSTGSFTAEPLVCPECNSSDCLTEWHGSCPKCLGKLLKNEAGMWD